MANDNYPKKTWWWVFLVYNLGILMGHVAAKEPSWTLFIPMAILAGIALTMIANRINIHVLDCIHRYLKGE